MSTNTDRWETEASSLEYAVGVAFDTYVRESWDQWKAMQRTAAHFEIPQDRVMDILNRREDV